ncbi:MAG: DUF695 domain-containing protein [Thiohalomonadales bacterium]
MEKTQYRVVIPEEKFGGFEFIQDDLPGIASVNVALTDFEPMVVFGWHLSLLIQYQDHVKNELPSRAEQDILYEFEDYLQPLIKDKGNGLFLARVTQGGNRELIWRIHKPEIANEVLRSIMNTKKSLRPIDYRIDPDKNWDKAKWYLDGSNSQPGHARGLF